VPDMLSTPLHMLSTPLPLRRSGQGDAGNAGRVRALPSSMLHRGGSLAAGERVLSLDHMKPSTPPLD
jgi:hypothetical protein